MSYQEQINDIAARLHGSKRLLFITGAGISAESGLPTYRGVGGLYNNDDMPEENLPIEVILSGDTMQSNPELTWKYIARIEQACRGAGYNPAHKIIAEMESSFETLVFTQNIDGFHRDAGSTNVVDIHGDMHSLRCRSESCSYLREITSLEQEQIPPKCPKCQDYLRPNVVLFGEMLPMEKISRFDEESAKGFDMVFTIGTTAVFPYIAAPVYQAVQEGRMTIEINPDKSEVSDIVGIHLETTAVKALTDIWQAYQQSAAQAG